MQKNDRKIRSTLYGRDELLQEICSAYDTAASGLPQCIALIGTTGIGKTRLAQELYRWLAVNRDPRHNSVEGYWPDSFIEENQSDTVNPDIQAAPYLDMPFLWWGLKFENGRPPWEALARSHHYLLAHSARIIHQRSLKTLDDEGWSQLRQLITTAAGMIPVVGTLASGIDLWSQMTSAYKRQVQRAKASEYCKSLEQASSEIESNLVQTILQIIKLFLDQSGTEDSTIPVVLLLDDAQWMDSASLILFRELWNQAVERKWKLMVVATHWDSEWITRSCNSSKSRTTTFAGIFEDLKVLNGESHLRSLTVPGVPHGDLARWITNLLPGLTSDQISLVLEKTRTSSAIQHSINAQSGSPRICEELLSMLTERPRRFFDSGNLNGRLSPEAEAEIKEHIADVRDIVRAKFEDLAPEVQQALGWSSMQGARFLREVTLSIGDKLNPLQAKDTLIGALEKAEIDHGWIQPIRYRSNDQGRLNICEFRSHIFYEVAKSRLDLSRDDERVIKSTVACILEEWLQGKKLDLPYRSNAQSSNGNTHFTIPELRDILQMACAHFRPEDEASRANFTSEHWLRYGLALRKLLDLEMRSPEWGEPVYWEQAKRVAREFATARDLGWPLESFGILDQVKVSEFLRRMNQFDAAEKLIRSVLSQISDSESAAKFGLNTSWRVFAELSDIYAEKNNPKLAIDILLPVWNGMPKEQNLLSFKLPGDVALNYGVLSRRVGELLRDADIPNVATARGRLTTIDFYLFAYDLFIWSDKRIRPERIGLREATVTLSCIAQEMDEKGMMEIDLKGNTMSSLQLRLQAAENFLSILNGPCDRSTALHDLSVTLSIIAEYMQRNQLTDVDALGGRKSSLDFSLLSLKYCKELKPDEDAPPSTLSLYGNVLKLLAGLMDESPVEFVEIDTQQMNADQIRLLSYEALSDVARRFGPSPAILHNILWLLLKLVSDELDQVQPSEDQVSAFFDKGLALLKQIEQLGWNCDETKHLDKRLRALMEERS